MCDEPTWPELPQGVERDPHLRTTGENEMLAQLRVPVGRPQLPSVSSPAARNSGPYPEADGAWAYSQDGVKLFRFDELGTGRGATYKATNTEASTVSAGLAVAAASGGVQLADQALDTPTVRRAAVGLVVADAAAGAQATVQTGGPLTLSDWTAATGAATLTPEARYWLGEGGLLTETPPSSGLLQIVGTAAAADTLVIQPQLVGRL